jgi:DNA-binding Lrp family transcriptional regulator
MAKEKMIDLLYELIKNSRRSDRDLAKILHVSQPTITRMRKKLETNDFILEYTLVPNFAKLGFEISG